MTDELAFHERSTLCALAWVPVPESVSVVGELPASLIKEIVPDDEPAADGAKSTLNETLCPAATVTGKFIPLTE